MDVDLALDIEHQILLNYLVDTHALEHRDLLGLHVPSHGNDSNHATPNQPSDLKVANLSIDLCLSLLLVINLGLFVEWLLILGRLSILLFLDDLCTATINCCLTRQSGVIQVDYFASGRLEWRPGLSSFNGILLSEELQWQEATICALFHGA